MTLTHKRPADPCKFGFSAIKGLVQRSACRCTAPEGHRPKRFRQLIISARGVSRIVLHHILQPQVREAGALWLHGSRQEFLREARQQSEYSVVKSGRALAYSAGPPPTGGEPPPPHFALGDGVIHHSSEVWEHTIYLAFSPSSPEMKCRRGIARCRREDLGTQQYLALAQRASAVLVGGTRQSAFIESVLRSGSGPWWSGSHLNLISTSS